MCTHRSKGLRITMSSESFPWRVMHFAISSSTYSSAMHKCCPSCLLTASAHSCSCWQLAHMHVRCITMYRAGIPKAVCCRGVDGVLHGCVHLRHVLHGPDAAKCYFRISRLQPAARLAVHPLWNCRHLVYLCRGLVWSGAWCAEHLQRRNG